MLIPEILGLAAFLCFTLLGLAFLPKQIFRRKQKLSLLQHGFSLQEILNNASGFSSSSPYRLAVDDIGYLSPLAKKLVYVNAALNTLAPLRGLPRDLNRSATIFLLSRAFGVSELQIEEAITDIVFEPRYMKSTPPINTTYLSEPSRYE